MKTVSAVVVCFQSNTNFPSWTVDGFDPGLPLLFQRDVLTAVHTGIFAAWKKESDDGYFLPEAFLHEHWRQRFMGELPHQWVEIYCSCECSEFVEYWIKFSAGIAAAPWWSSQAYGFRPWPDAGQDEPERHAEVGEGKKKTRPGNLKDEEQPHHAAVCGPADHSEPHDPR